MGYACEAVGPVRAWGVRNGAVGLAGRGVRDRAVHGDDALRRLPPQRRRRDARRRQPRRPGAHQSAELFGWFTPHS